METEKKIIGRCPLCGGNVVKTCKGYRCEHNIGDSPSCVLNINAIIGNRKMADKYPKVYAEKLLYLRESQYSPNHFHWYKTEDIINRGGGNILIRVYNSLPDESIDKESDVTVHCDGRTYTVPAGTQIKLTPGESIHIQQYMYHDFEVEPGTGAVLLGEVSQCNDDNTDNRFNPPVGRFPKIEEDEAPYRLLCNEYPAAKD